MTSPRIDLESQKWPEEEEVVYLDMEKVRKAFFKKIEDQPLKKRQQVRAQIRKALLANSDWQEKEIPFYLKTNDQASEELFDDVLDQIFRNFPKEEGAKVLELFVNKMLKRLFKKEEEKK